MMVDALNSNYNRVNYNCLCAAALQLCKWCKLLYNSWDNIEALNSKPFIIDIDIKIEIESNQIKQMMLTLRMLV